MTGHDTTLKTGLLPWSLTLAVVPLVIGAVALVAGAPVLGVLFVGIGALAGWLVGTSELRIDSGELRVRMLALRGRSVRLAEITSVYCEPGMPTFGRAPAVWIVDGRGHRISVCLGWWRREAEFLAHLENAVAVTDARTDPQIRQLFRRKPPGAYWIRDRLSRRRSPQGRPFIRRPAEQAVFRAGVASILLGLVLTSVAAATRPGLGSFGLVPEAVVAFTAILLGGVAILLARPRREVRRLSGHPWLPLLAALVPTVAVVLLALDDFGVPVDIDRGTARMIVTAGLVVITPGVILVVFVGIANALLSIWRRFLAAGAERWFR